MAGLLEQEIAQTKPLSLVNRAAANLHRSSALLMREVGACLSAKGVSAQQYNILRILHGAGDNGLRCGEVASRLVTPTPTPLVCSTGWWPGNGCGGRGTRKTDGW